MPSAASSAANCVKQAGCYLPPAPQKHDPPCLFINLDCGVVVKLRTKPLSKIYNRNDETCLQIYLRYRCHPTMCWQRHTNRYSVLIRSRADISIPQHRLKRCLSSTALLHQAFVNHEKLLRLPTLLVCSGPGEIQFYTNAPSYIWTAIVATLACLLHPQARTTAGVFYQASVRRVVGRARFCWQSELFAAACNGKC